ncbi:hypothetical protein MHYP_G00051780 [Metynnis hypsauchen]
MLCSPSPSDNEKAATISVQPLANEHHACVLLGLSDGKFYSGHRTDSEIGWTDSKDFTAASETEDTGHKSHCNEVQVDM